MKKKFLKFLKELFDNPWAKFAGYVLLVIIILGFYGIFDGDLSTKIIFRKIGGIITSEETLSVILAAILSLCFTRFLKNCDKYLEESYKVNDDHHAIINMYNGHEKKWLYSKKNISDKVGAYMSLVNLDYSKSDNLKPDIKDRFSGEYEKQNKAIQRFKDGILFLPTVNVFANVEGNTEIIFNDKRDIYQLTDFMIENATNLLAAHENSIKSNNSTVRLTDFHYDEEKKCLTLDTQRSTYFHMLMTNRCMDYEVFDGVSIRTAYEYNNFISELSQSQLSNQIGINGLVLTSDGYALIEKRDHRKTTWKNKFAQSISLALKTRDLKIGNSIIEPTYEDANEKLANVIYKSLNSNFGLEKKDFQGFELKDNFLGIARDLLEGGKPNFYFYIETVFGADELCERLRQSAMNTGKGALSKQKLSSDYYIVPFDDLKIDFQYALTLNRANCYWPRRHIYPRSNWARSAVSAIRHKVLLNVKPKFTRECGEALLVTISYLELCRERIGIFQKKE